MFSQNKLKAQFHFLLKSIIGSDKGNKDKSLVVKTILQCKKIFGGLQFSVMSHIT